MEFEYFLEVPDDFPDCRPGHIYINYRFVLTTVGVLICCPPDAMIYKMFRAIRTGSGYSRQSDGISYDIHHDTLHLRVVKDGGIVLDFGIPTSECIAAFTRACGVLDAFSADPIALAAANPHTWV